MCLISCGILELFTLFSSTRYTRRNMNVAVNNILNLLLCASLLSCYIQLMLIDSHSHAAMIMIYLSPYAMKVATIIWAKWKKNTYLTYMVLSVPSQRKCVKGSRYRKENLKLPEFSFIFTLLFSVSYLEVKKNNSSVC